MTKQEWLTQVKKDAPKLRSLIEQFHPATPDGPRKGIGPITAPGAESACKNVRTAIAEKEVNLPTPARRFDAALLAEDADEINSLLNSAWFGVPESTSCWQIDGFKEAVDLMDDPPED
jgi:hypothetical protein